MHKSDQDHIRDEAARLLKKYAARLPKLTSERRSRIVSAVAADLERKHGPSKKVA